MRLAVWLTGYLLKRNLSVADRRSLVVHILHATAGPLHAVIDTNDDGEMLINGKTVDTEKMGQLRAHARSGLENKAFALIRRQVRYEAFLGAAIKSALPEDLYFYRAALWWGQQEDKYLKLLAGREESDPDIG